MIGLVLLLPIIGLTNKADFQMIKYCSSGKASSNLVQSSYTSQEQWALEEFRPMVLDSLEEDYERKDAFLIRWLRACDLDLRAATKMLQEAKLWRKQNNMSTILTESFPEVYSAHFNVDGIDREGNPVAIFDIHHYNYKKLLIKGRKNDIARFMHQFLERAEVKIREIQNLTGKNVQVVTILDANKFTLREHGCFACLEFCLSFLKDFERLHPEFNRYVVAVNAHRFGRPVVDMLKAVISKNSLKAFKIFGVNKAEWSSFLLKIIAPDQLPVRFGGTKIR